MVITVFEPDERIQNLAVKRFTEGLYQHSEQVRVANIQDDVAVGEVSVLFGLNTAKELWIKERTELEGGRCLVMDYGSIRRPKLWTVGWDGLMGRADFLNFNSPSDRWVKYGSDIKPWRKHGDHILLIGQVPWDGAVRNTNIVQWAIETAEQLSKISSREIVFRPHPLAIRATPNIPLTTWSIRTLVEDLENAHCVVTYNSTTASMSVIEGTPVFALGEGSIAWDIAENDLNNVETPRKISKELRNQWCYNLGYTQWTLEEFGNGVAWEHLKRGVV